jgi:transcriptional regulator with XRE-family HTH domain
VQVSADSEQDPVARLGEVIRTRRETSGLSLRAAAEKARISPAHLSEVERGVKELSLGRLGALAEALDTTAGEIVLDLAIALGAAPALPARHPLGFAPDPREEIAWAAARLPDTDLRAVAAFGSFLAAQAKGGLRP